SLAALRALTGEDDSPGVDLVEVGLPYSDPVMDGATVQRAGTRALERGVRTRDVFSAVETVAATGTPAVVMTYWNLIERYGADRFARDLAAAGGSGAITPDLTPDEAQEWLRGLRADFEDGRVQAIVRIFHFSGTSPPGDPAVVGQPSESES
ncbi:MAG: tryptophan synthase alpha chain, partial [Solirubrobacteraceae bacterium]|nr:tryptophan synthase alpha chain [Solirubrobacteraceae bacterium]